MLNRSFWTTLTLCLLLASAPVALQAQEQNSARAFALARQLYDDQLYELAADQFSDFISRYPAATQVAEAWFLQGESLFHQRSFDAAVTAYRSLLQRHTAINLRDQAAFRICQCLVHTGKQAEARSALLQFMNDYPSSSLYPDAQYWYGEALLRGGDADEAVRHFHDIVENHPDSGVADYALFAAADIEEKRGAWPEAIAAYERLLREYPRSALAEQVTFRLGMARYGHKAYDQAIADLSGAIVAWPASRWRGEAQYFIGEAFARKGEYDKASKAFALIAAMNGHPYADDAQYSLGLALVNLNKPEEALAAWQQLLTTSSDAELKSAALFQSGRTQLRSGRHEEALQLFKQLLTDYPRSADAPNALFEHAALLFQQKEYGKARTIYGQILERFPAAPVAGDAAVMIGECHLGEGNIEAANQAFRQAAGGYENEQVRAQAIYKLALSRFQSKEYDLALKNLDDVLRVYPHSAVAADARFWRAESFFKLERFGDALADYQAFIKESPLSPRLAEAWYGLGYAALKTGQYPLSAEAFGTAASSAASAALRGDALLRRGDALANAKSYAAAVQSYEKAFESSSDDKVRAEARYQTGLAWFRAGELARAQEILDEVAQKWPQSAFAADALYLSGRASFRSNRYTEAVATFNRLLWQYPASPLLDNATYAIADCYYNLGDYDQAVSQYRKVIDVFPRSELVADALTGLQWSLTQKGESARAESIVQEYINRLPDQETAAKVIDRQAAYFRDNGQYPEAIAQYEKLLSAYKNTAEAQSAWYGLALCHQAQNNPQAALAAWRKQWESFPRSGAAPEALLAAAQLAAEKGDAAQAALWYDKITRDYPASPQAAAAAYARGVLDIEGDQIDRAESYFKTLAARDKGGADRVLARLGLARVYIGKKQYAEAESLLNQLLEEGNPPAAAEAQYLLASILRQRGEGAKASLAWLKIKYLYPEELKWVVPGIYNAAQCNEELGRYGDARRLYQSLVDDYPGQTEIAAKAAERLQAIAGK